MHGNALYKFHENALYNLVKIRFLRFLRDHLPREEVSKLSVSERLARVYQYSSKDQFLPLEASTSPGRHIPWNITIKLIAISGRPDTVASPRPKSKAKAKAGAATKAGANAGAKVSAKPKAPLSGRPKFPKRLVPVPIFEAAPGEARAARLGALRLPLLCQAVDLVQLRDLEMVWCERRLQ